MKTFQTPELRIIYLKVEDILTNSQEGGGLSDGYQDNELPMVPVFGK